MQNEIAYIFINDFLRKRKRSVRGGTSYDSSWKQDKEEWVSYERELTRQYSYLQHSR